MISIGHHKVTCASIVSPSVDEMLQGEKVDILYCDPPWNNMAYWKTLAQRMTGQDLPQITHDELYDRIVELIRRYVRGHVFIETGCAQERYVTARLGEACADVVAYHAVYSGGPHVLLVGNTSGQSQSLPFDPYDEPELETRAISSVAIPGGIVLDPCCGLGYTAIAAIANGMRFRGNEFNRKRLEKTIAKLEHSLNGQT